MRGRSRGHVFVTAVVCAASALASQACRGPTEVTIDISTQTKCNEIDGTGIRVAADPVVAETSDFSTTDTQQCDVATGEVGTLVLVPGADSGAVVVVAGYHGTMTSDCTADKGYANCIVARRRFAFISHDQLTIPISLTPDCVNIPCDALTTCVNGACVSSSVSCGENGCDPVGNTGPDGAGVNDDGAITDGAIADTVLPPNDGGPLGGKCFQIDGPVCGELSVLLNITPGVPEASIGGDEAGSEASVPEGGEAGNEGGPTGVRCPSKTPCCVVPGAPSASCESACPGGKYLCCDDASRCPTNPQQYCALVGPSPNAEDPQGTYYACADLSTLNLSPAIVLCKANSDCPNARCDMSTSPLGNPYVHTCAQ